MYGFSSGILPNETQEFVFRGFLLGLSTYSKVDVSKDLSLQYSNSGSLTSPYMVAREVLKLKPLIITGFPSSFESQLAAPILKGSNILTFFASSSNLSLKDMGSNIYSSSEDILEVNRYVAEMIIKHHDKKLGGVIYNPFDYFSVNQLETWKILEKDFPGLSIDFISTGPDGKISDLSLEKYKKYNFIVTTLFPSKSYELFRFLDENHIDVPIYTNSAWYKMEFHLLTRFFSRKKSSVYSVRFRDYDYQIEKNLKNNYKSKYGVEPLPEVFVGYDLGIIVGGVLQKSRENKISVEKVLKNGFCVAGSPFGSVCLGRHGGFVPRNIILEDINASR